MFYETSRGHDLPFNPFKAIVAPRPIGWISTLDAKGRPNLAPYSFFNALSTVPPILGYGSDGPKDSVVNARDTGEFVFNLATLPLAEAMNISSKNVPLGTNEFELAGLKTAPGKLVKAPRVAECPAALECRVTEIIRLKDVEGHVTDRFVVLGQVIGVHLDDRYVVDGRFDVVAAQVLARCGYKDYCVVSQTFELPALPQ